jgi:hypothetical protein
MNKEKWNELVDKKKRADEEMKAAAKAFFTAEAKVLFENNAELESFAWRQYTPYFNDGDECIFRVNTDTIVFTWNTPITEEEKDPFEHKWGAEVYSIEQDVKRGNKDWQGRPTAFTSKHQTALNVGEFLDQFDEDTYKFLFGDHIEITVHRDGSITDEQFDHD